MKKRMYPVFAVTVSLLAMVIMAQKPIDIKQIRDIVKPSVTTSASSARGEVMWLNHLDLLPGDPSVKTSFSALKSLTGGLSGLNIESTTTGDTGLPAGNKVVEMGVPTIPGYTITGVRVCYELSSTRSFITQIRLAQLQNPPASALVKLDDARDLTAKGPVCVTSAPTSIDPADGAVRLSLRLNFGSTSDVIVIRAVGLVLQPK